MSNLLILLLTMWICAAIVDLRQKDCAAIFIVAVLTGFIGLGYAIMHAPH